MDFMERIETIHKHITEPYEEAEKCLRTNYHGIKAVTKALLPLLQSSSHGRIVNMSSDYGLLRVNGRRLYSLSYMSSFKIESSAIFIYAKEKKLRTLQTK
jgi:NAD(P)-dependent dehydrogenase (short-subunit alcohol dehydrogenase family)